VDWFLAAAFVAGVPAMLQQRVTLPRWIVVPSLAVGLIFVIHTVLPTLPMYMSARFRLQTAVTVVESPAVITVQWLIALAILPVLVRAVCLATDRSPQRIVWAWMAGAAISATIGLSDYLGITNVGETLIGYANTSGRASGLASHANNLGFACAMAAPIAIHLMGRGRAALSAASTTGLILLTLGAVVSGSRGSQVGCVLAVLAGLLLVPAGRRVLPVFLWLGAVVTCLVAWFRPGLFTGFSEVIRFGQGSNSDESDVGRQLIAHQGVLDFQHNPVWGVGFEVLTQSHSIFLQLLAAGGVVLFGAMVYFLGSALWTSFKLSRDGSVLAGFLGCSILIWIAVGSIENQLTDRYLYVPIAALCALTALRADASACGEGGRVGPAQTRSSRVDGDA
jgi:hypothetical protein